MTAADRRTWLIIAGIVAVFVLLVPISALVWRVNYDYTLVTVAAGGAVLGIVSGVLGSFAVLRQQSLMGDALSHAALPGVAITFLLFGRELGWLLVGAGVAGWLGVMFINSVTRTTRIKQDAAMGIALTAFFAFGLTLLTYIQSRSDARQAGLDQFIFGQAASIKRQDVLLITGVGLVAFVIVALFWKEFKLMTFDPEFARANGFAVRFLDVLLSTLIVVAIVLGLQLAGVILMVGMLIAPAVAARQWMHHLGQMIVLSAVFGGFAGAAGAILSGIQAGLPTGPLIIVAASALVFLSIAFAPDRGLVWTLWRRRQDRQRFAAQNVLRDVYRHALQHDDAFYPAPGGMLAALRGSAARSGLRQLEQTGLVREAESDGWALTDTGLAAARAAARNLRLWELYRQYAEELHLPIVPEDHQQPIEKALPQADVRRLESLLDTESRQNP
jgi:manganese/zinc/iron transport system permease protein